MRLSAESPSRRPAERQGPAPRPFDPPRATCPAPILAFAVGSPSAWAGAAPAAAPSPRSVA